MRIARAAGARAGAWGDGDFPAGSLGGIESEVGAPQESAGTVARAGVGEADPGARLWRGASAVKGR